MQLSPNPIREGCRGGYDLKLFHRGPGATETSCVIKSECHKGSAVVNAYFFAGFS
jgi:hypothetical protein